jgi:DNA-binding winged helix-turn-helix (wHTH) protein/TolB-like protein
MKFGVFDFDPAGKELRRDGVPVRLEAQPAQVLALLLAQAGQVVTREALRQALWGSDTFVDFDRGLNYCIAQIRAALKDSAESPRFIRTLPKRGYQFIAPVQADAVAAAKVSVAKTARWSRFSILALFVILEGGLIVITWREWRKPSTPPPLVKVAVSRFDNETGNGNLDRFTDALADSVVANLTASASGRYGVIGNAAILRQPRDQRDLKAIASSLSAGYVVLGQVQQQDSRVRVLAHLIRMPDQTHLWVTRVVYDPAELAAQEPAIAERIGNEFSRRLSASPASTSR